MAVTGTVTGMLLFFLIRFWIFTVLLFGFLTYHWFSHSVGFVVILTAIEYLAFWLLTSKIRRTMNNFRDARRASNELRRIISNDPRLRAKYMGTKS
jgi:Na+-driven multidrug efflux pump